MANLYFTPQLNFLVRPLHYGVSFHKSYKYRPLANRAPFKYITILSSIVHENLSAQYGLKLKLLVELVFTITELRLPEKC